MPIYEFYCSSCHTIFNFLSKRINIEATPCCPKCGKVTARKPSTFAMSRNRPEPKAGEGGPGGEGDMMDPFANMDEAQMESAMESLASEADGIDENDPRQAANVMRKLFDATGMPMGGGMQEALKRMESGEDPEKIEEDMGDLLEKDPFAGETARKSTERRIPRRPAFQDPQLYDM
ncbi:MAG: zinc ribbon domain-containing protein [Vicinamibacteria bacterium]|nr:zinc ribbon domain-containing protein [Vicinamibacteria bacterium]